MTKYSQFNTEEILQGLGVDKMHGGRCAEVGASDGLRISNTAWLIRHCGWKGWFVEKGTHDIAANYRDFDVVIHSGVAATPDNINDLIPGDLDFLSIDIDSNDYHVWKAYKGLPSIVAIEFNPTKGTSEYIMPYSPNYDRKKAPNRDDYGASLKSMIKLGRAKGYALYDIDGVNAFFIKTDSLGGRND